MTLTLTFYKDKDKLKTCSKLCYYTLTHALIFTSCGFNPLQGNITQTHVINSQLIASFCIELHMHYDISVNKRILSIRYEQQITNLSKIRPLTKTSPWI